jgi:hypothetical protein
MYKVTLGRVRATIVVVEKQWILHNLCMYSAAMRMLRIVICGLPRSTIFVNIVW